MIWIGQVTILQQRSKFLKQLVYAYVCEFYETTKECVCVRACGGFRVCIHRCVWVVFLLSLYCFVCPFKSIVCCLRFCSANIHLYKHTTNGLSAAVSVLSVSCFYSVMNMAEKSNKMFAHQNPMNNTINQNCPNYHHSYDLGQNRILLMFILSTSL